VREVNYFKELYWTLAKTGMGQLFMAKKDGGAIAAGMSSRFGRMASLLYLSNDYTIKYTGWAVQWEMVRWAIGEGCTVYDFAGTGTTYPPKETDKGYGVYQFKKSFGADIVCWYGYADYIFKPALYAGLRAIERSLPLGERIFLDLPKELMYRLRRKPPVETEGEKDAA
jgi:lipid II:glycine glycyltransferase (peptidoglycan interpeptide bridge formation enzyme)